LFRKFTGICLLVLFGAFGSSVASASEHASIAGFLNPDGTGGMIANSQTNPEGETWNWESCTPLLSACRPLGQGRIIETFSAKPEVVFRTTSSLGATAVSSTWHGNVASKAPPTMVGRVQANELVTPIPGRWRGGWTDDLDRIQLAACSTRNDAHCTTLTDRHYTEGCPNDAAVIAPAFTGKYLRVADQRISAQTLELDYGLGSPYGQPVWKASKTTSVAFFGRIAPAVGNEPAECGPEPLVEASVAEGGGAIVRCGFGCNTTLTITQGRHRARVSRRLEPLPYIPARARDIPRLRIPARRLTDFRSGYAQATITVDGKRAARRAIWLEP